LKKKLYKIIFTPKHNKDKLVNFFYAIPPTPSFPTSKEKAENQMFNFHMKKSFLQLDRRMKIEWIGRRSKKFSIQLKSYEKIFLFLRKLFFCEFSPRGIHLDIPFFGNIHSITGIV
jgi:hypothetical protein